MLRLQNLVWVGYAQAFTTESNTTASLVPLNLTHVFGLPQYPNLVKLARFWITLATSVSFLEVFSSGYSAVKFNTMPVYE